jgi:hypothetical protein
MAMHGVKSITKRAPKKLFDFRDDINPPHFFRLLKGKLGPQLESLLKDF